jgi:GH25 family lysozyme M1 (1,4-beta-N-acetylmuramidase)
MIEPIVDVSKWQGEIDADKMLAGGTLGMYIKAGGTDKSNGSSYTDGRFRQNAEKFAARIPVGYYYFFYPHFSGVKQALYFAQLYRSVPWNLPPALDLEDNPNNVVPAVFQREVKAFIDTIQQELNVETVIYTRASFWNANIGNPAWAGGLKLWVARYGATLTHPWEDNPAKLRPLPWTDWWIWQYTADENRRGREFGAESHALDINRVNMTHEAFMAFANWGGAAVTDSPVTTETAEEVEMTPAAVDSSMGAAGSEYPFLAFLRAGFRAIRVRSRPASNENNTVGVLKQGYNFTVHKEHAVGDDLWWLVELPDGTAGWAAKRFQAVTFLEKV